MARKLTSKELKGRVKGHKSEMQRIKIFVSAEMQTALKTDGTAFMVDDKQVRSDVATFMRTAKKLTTDLGKLHNLENS